MLDKLPCPHCGCIFSLEQLLVDLDGKLFFKQFAELPDSVSGPYIRYLLRLFRKPGKATRWGVYLRQTEAIKPMILAQTIQRDGVSYQVTFGQWANAFGNLAEHPPSTLRLPLKDHNYLLSILASQAQALSAEGKLTACVQQDQATSAKTSQTAKAIGKLDGMKQ